MVEMQTAQPAVMAASAKPPPPLLSPSLSTTATSAATAVSSIPTAIPETSTSRLRDQLVMNTPVNQNGSFEADRVIKSGYVQKRTQKTKTWRTIFLVLRPNTLSIYKSDKEDKLRRKIYLSDLTAVALLKDPKQKRQHVFGLFSPSRNFHLQANSAQDAADWVESIRSEARIEEEEEEMFLSSPAVRRQSYHISSFFGGGLHRAHVETALPEEPERFASSSPEPAQVPQLSRRLSSQIFQQPQYSLPESSGWSGNELASSDCSENGDITQQQQRQHTRGLSFESLDGQSPPSTAMGALSIPKRGSLAMRSSTGRNFSQASVSGLVDDPDRVVWQGWLYLLRSKGGVRQWKDLWAVLRPRNLILYKDESEYTAQLVMPLSQIVNVVERDPISRTKAHCLQIITEEKTFRFSAHDEESLLQCLGAFKSLLTKRRDIEMRVAAAAAASSTSVPASSGSTTAPAPIATATSTTTTAPVVHSISPTAIVPPTELPLGLTPISLTGTTTGMTAPAMTAPAPIMT